MDAPTYGEVASDIWRFQSVAGITATVLLLGNVAQGILFYFQRKWHKEDKEPLLKLLDEARAGMAKAFDQSREDKIANHETIIAATSTIRDLVNAVQSIPTKIENLWLRQKGN